MIMTLLQFQEFWWLAVGAVLFLFALTIGFDLGVAGLIPFLGKTNTQRRIIINSVGPTWAGNQIWLVFGGGALFAIWPQVYATVFSGLYITMIIFLWALFTRPVAFEWRKKIEAKWWTNTMDWALACGSLFAAFAIGLLLGNVMQGIPFHFDDTLRSYFSGDFWTLINPFAIVVGLVSLFMMLMHGSNFLQLTATQDIAKRARRMAGISSVLFLACFLIAGYMALHVKWYILRHAAGINAPLDNVVTRHVGALWHNYHVHEWLWIAPALGLVGALFSILCNIICLRGWSFVGSAVATLGALTTFGASTFPFVVPSSSMPNHSLTIYNASSNLYSLNALFWAACIFLPLILIYTVFIYIKMMKRVTPELIERDHLY